MARNPTKSAGPDDSAPPAPPDPARLEAQIGEGETIVAGDDGASPRMKGGALGVVPLAIQTIPGMTQPTQTRPLDPRFAVSTAEKKDVPIPRRWRVVADPSRGASVILNSSSVVLPNGKILDDRHFDVELVRRQGVELVEVE